VARARKNNPTKALLKFKRTESVSAYWEMCDPANHTAIAAAAKIAAFNQGEREVKSI
jgi:hypothetical protein